MLVCNRSTVRTAQRRAKLYGVMQPSKTTPSYQLRLLSVPGNSFMMASEMASGYASFYTLLLLRVETDSELEVNMRKHNAFFSQIAYELHRHLKV